MSKKKKIFPKEFKEFVTNTDRSLDNVLSKYWDASCNRIMCCDLESCKYCKLHRFDSEVNETKIEKVKQRIIKYYNKHNIKKLVADVGAVNVTN